MKPVSIIIPSYCPTVEVEYYLRRAVDYIYRNTPRHLYELTLVSNGNWPGNLPAVDTHVYVHRPIGAAAAFNMGVRLSSAKYVVFFSNDVFVRPGWLEAFMHVYEADERSGILEAQDDNSSYTGLTYDAHWGALYMVNRELLLEVGTLDDVKLPWLYHDQDQSIRFRDAGYHVARTGMVQVEHVNRATFGLMQPGKRAEVEAEKQEMVRRWGTSEFHEWVKWHEAIERHKIVTRTRVE